MSGLKNKLKTLSLVLIAILSMAIAHASGTIMMNEGYIRSAPYSVATGFSIGLASLILAYGNHSLGENANE